MKESGKSICVLGAGVATSAIKEYCGNCSILNYGIVEIFYDNELPILTEMKRPTNRHVMTKLYKQSSSVYTTFTTLPSRDTLDDGWYGAFRLVGLCNKTQKNEISWEKIKEVYYTFPYTIRYIDIEGTSQSIHFENSTEFYDALKAVGYVHRYVLKEIHNRTMIELLQEITDDLLDGMLIKRKGRLSEWPFRYGVWRKPVVQRDSDNENAETFDFISIELLSPVEKSKEQMIADIKQNQKEYLKEAKYHISENKEYKKYGVPVSYLKCFAISVSKEGSLVRFRFELPELRRNKT